MDDPAMPTDVWLPGVYVTAVSHGGCSAGYACQIFVQSAETFADLASGSQQAIKLFISANTAEHFTGVAVGDKVDADGYAWRYNLTGQHELLVEVNLQLPGCAKKVGTGNPTPVVVTLDDLSVPAYEDTVGPLLVRVNGVTGKPALPTETFGLWNTGVFTDAGVNNLTSLSPYFLTGGAFTGLTQSHLTDFTSLTGVFGIFILSSSGAKYEELYPRNAADIVIMTVH